MQKFILVAGSLCCNEHNLVILYGRNVSNFVAVFAEETETSVWWASCASDFLGECSNLAPISKFFSSVNT